MAVIALVAGELTAYLTVNKDNYSRGLREAKGEMDSLARDAERQSTATENRSSRIVTSTASAMAQVNRNADRQGRDAGGKLSQGISQGIIRNSPLIVAGVGAALAAGAPLATAGAVTLFAGVGAVAAAQSERVKSAWLGTWQAISRGAQADAAILVPVFERMAGKIGASFERMRPLLRDAFAAVGPQIDTFTDSLTRAAENALPGLVRAVQGANPVVAGLGSFMESIGDGLTAFFDKLTAHAPAAGEAFAEIGDILADLLPILGELLGQGAELAADVLPLMTTSLGLLLKVVDLLGPALPAVVTGLLAFKAVGGITTMVDGFAKALGRVGATNAASAVSRFTGVLGPLGAAVGGTAFAIGEHNRRIDEFGDTYLTTMGKLRQGGAAAESAREQLDNLRDAADRVGNGFGNMFPEEHEEAIHQAEQAFNDLWNEMTPLERATYLVEQRQGDLATAIDRHGVSSREARSAAEALTSAEKAQRDATEDLERAHRGVTEAMLARADAVLGAANADLAHRNALLDADQALDDYNQAIADYGSESDEAVRAGRDFEGSLLRVVDAAGRLATESLPANMDANQKLALSQLAQLDQLHELEAMYGENLPLNIREMIGELEAATTGYNRADLEAAALAEQAEETGKRLKTLGDTTATPKIKGDPSIFAGVYAETMSKIQNVNAQTPTPKIKGDSSVFAGVYADSMGKLAQLGGQRPTPAVGLADYASAGIGKIQAKLDYLQSKTIYVTTVERTVKTKAAGGKIDAIRAASGRKVVGAGGPTDDLVPALGPGGSQYLLSNSEWIVNAMASRQQGDARMAALNAGRADIVMRGFADGGSPGINPVTGTGATVAPIVNVNVYGVDFSSRRDRRRLVMEIRDGLVEVGRGES